MPVCFCNFNKRISIKFLNPLNKRMPIRDKSICCSVDIKNRDIRTFINLVIDVLISSLNNAVQCQSTSVQVMSQSNAVDAVIILCRVECAARNCFTIINTNCTIRCTNIVLSSKSNIEQAASRKNDINCFITAKKRTRKTAIPAGKACSTKIFISKVYSSFCCKVCIFCNSKNKVFFVIRSIFPCKAYMILIRVLIVIDEVCIQMSRSIWNLVQDITQVDSHRIRSINSIIISI